MPDDLWAHEFNHAYFGRFKFTGGSHLDLSNLVAKSDEYLLHGQELLQEELATESDSFHKNGSRTDRARYRNCVDECSRAIQCTTDGFINALKIFYPNSNHPKLSIDQQIAQARQFGENYKAILGWPRAFPPKITALINTKVLKTQSALFWANGLRKELIHEYKDPTLKEALTLLSIATMYCSVLKSKLQWIWEEIELVSEFGEQLQLSFRPKPGKIYYEYRLDEEALSDCEELLHKDGTIRTFKNELTAAGQGNSSHTLTPDVIEARRTVNTIRSNIPAPDNWQGEIDFTDIQPYRNWLGLLLEWSGRTYND